MSRFPWLTVGIIAICTLVQLYATFVAPSLDDIEAMISRLRAAEDDRQAEVVMRQMIEAAEKIPMVRWGYPMGSGFGYRMLTAAFVHGGWLHLIGNMLFLWLAGSALEDRLGRLRFAVLYVAGAFASTYAFELMYSGKATVLVGASGAISATMGAFLVYFARTNIMMWYWMFRASGTFYMKAYLALPLWLGEQFLSKWWEGATGGISNIAYEAHIGGFVFGVAAAYAARAIWPATARSDDDDEHAPRVAPAAALPEARVRPPTAPPVDTRYSANRARRPSRMPSSIPLDGPVPGVAPTREAINYAVATLQLTPRGLDATRENGVLVSVRWDEIVGVVARRLPSSETFVDIVSSPGSTLRIVPWTSIVGVEIAGSPQYRARRLVELVLEHNPGAKLDGGTRTFVQGQDALQIPDAETLAEHDRRLA